MYPSYIDRITTKNAILVDGLTFYSTRLRNMLGGTLRANYGITHGWAVHPATPLSTPIKDLLHHIENLTIAWPENESAKAELKKLNAATIRRHSEEVEKSISKRVRQLNPHYYV